MNEVESPAKKKNNGTFSQALRGEDVGIHLEDQDKFEKSEKQQHTPVKDSNYEDSLIE